MKSKKILSIILASIAIILASVFALFPFFEHKINWDYVASKLVLKAVDAGCLDIAKEISEDIKYKPFLGKANAHIALSKLRNESEESANKFIKSCGGNFDFEEYYARKLIDEISAEPEFAAGLLGLKYQSQIDSFKSPFLKAILLYNMSLKAKPKDAPTYAKQAFDILKSLPKSEELTTTCIEISNLAFNKNQIKDFFNSLKSCHASAHYHTALFKSLKNKKFRDYIWKNNRYDTSFYGLELRLEILSKKQKPPLEIGKRYKYILTNSGFNGITGDYTNFNIPLIAHVAFLSGKKELFKIYKDHCISPETLESIKGSKLGYLNNSAIFFTASDELNYALKFEELASSKHQKLYILNSIILELPLKKESIETVLSKLNFAK